tara:strand:- start:89 stop:250 length:162 start_codon:yes stop_codon:yes gene_type:complete
MDKREQLRQQLLHYMMLRTRHEKFLREIGQSNYFQPVIEELKQKILELDNEKR